VAFRATQAVEAYVQMDCQTKSDEQNGQTKARKPYKKPLLVVHGTVGELTQTGGNRRRDGINSRAPS